MSTPALQVHQTPGRLRVRCPQLKQNPARAYDAKCCLMQVKGVRSIDVNPVTGSLLIHFDPNVSTPDALMNAIVSSKTSVSWSDSPPHSRQPSLPAHATRKIAKVALAYAGEKAVEQLITALIAAVI